MAAEDIPNAVADPEATSRSSRRWRTACSRGSSTRSTSGACCSHPDGFAGRPELRRPDRHEQRVLRLQLAGRDPRRRDDRGGARLESRGARRGDDGLRRAAAALGRLRHVQDDLRRPPTRTPASEITILSIAQMLWDRGETDAWTQHMTTNPPKNTIPHAVLMHVAVGDHQVANVMSDVEARSIGASTAELPRGPTTRRRCSASRGSRRTRSRAAPRSSTGTAATRRRCRR